MGRLLNSYLALGIPAGAPLTVALRRYRWLAPVFHPDRFVQSRRAAAEQEMKRINDARDVLRAHFALKHKSASEPCECESWAEQESRPSMRKQSDKTSKSANVQAQPDNSGFNSRRAKLISDAGSSFRKDGERNATARKSDEVKDPSSEAAWPNRYGTYRINRVQYVDKISSQNVQTSGAVKTDSNQNLAIQAKTQPIVLPQWFLVVMALVFFSMAMAVNHHESLSTQFGGDTTESQ